MAARFPLAKEALEGSYPPPMLAASLAADLGNTGIFIASKLLLQNPSTMAEILSAADDTKVKELVDSLTNVGNPEERGIREDVRAFDMEAAKRAWKREYVIPSAMQLVAGKIIREARLWDPSKYYVPMCALVQSSGWGKSRLICELWREDIYVLYLSCMGASRAGFPGRTKLADIIDNQLSSNTELAAFLMSAVTVFTQTSLTAQEWIADQMDGNSKVHGDIQAKYDELKVSMARDKAQGEEESEFLIRSEAQQLRTLMESEERMLLLCVDEAGELSSPAFGRFRRSLRYIPATKNFFCVMLGTNRKVADLAAAKEEDLSARVRMGSGYEVFEPIYLVGESDMMPVEGGELTSREQVIRYGRPLWAAYFDSLGDMVDVEKVKASIDLATTKICGGGVGKLEEGEWVTKEIAVAVFGILVGLDVVAWGTLAHDLVARHMRTIVRISRDGRRVYTSCGAEPALAAAAAKLLHSFPGSEGKFLEKLIEVCVDGLVLENVWGELVVRILLLLVMHKLTSDENYVKHVTTRDYLTALLGEEYMLLLEENQVSMSGDVFFSCFIPVQVGCEEINLEDFHRCCAAAGVRRNESVLDMYVPLAWPKAIPETEGVRPSKRIKRDSENATEDGYGHDSLLIQVQNRRNEVSIEPVVEMLNGEERIPQRASIVFQLGSSKNEIQVTGSCVLVYGLDVFKDRLNNLTVDYLKQLVRAHEDIFKGVAAPEVSVVKKMLPLVFQ